MTQREVILALISLLSFAKTGEGLRAASILSRLMDDHQCDWATITAAQLRLSELADTLENEEKRTPDNG